MIIKKLNNNVTTKLELSVLEDAVCNFIDFFDEMLTSEALAVDDSYVIVRYSTKDTTIYAHYSTDANRFDANEAIVPMYNPISFYSHFNNKDVWYLFKICVYKVDEIQKKERDSEICKG